MKIVDGHYDILQDVRKKRLRGAKEVLKTDYYARFLDASVQAIICSIFIDTSDIPSAVQHALEQVESLKQEVEENPDLFCLVTNKADLQHAVSKQKIAFLLNFEGAEPLLSLQLLHTFYRLGVRGLGLAWSRRNLAADGCDFTGSLKKGGLTKYGIELVQEAQNLSMFIDISHLSDEGVYDVLQYCPHGVIASHSNARAIAANNRNLTDEFIQEIAKRDGMIGLNGCSIIAATNNQEATPDQLVKHLKYLIELAGENHVGFGFDFCDQLFPKDPKATTGPHSSFDIVKDYEAIPSFIHLLAESGFTPEILEKISHANWINFLEKQLPEA